MKGRAMAKIGVVSVDERRGRPDSSGDPEKYADDAQRDAAVERAIARLHRENVWLVSTLCKLVEQFGAPRTLKALAEAARAQQAAYKGKLDGLTRSRQATFIGEIAALADRAERNGL